MNHRSCSMANKKWSMRHRRCAMVHGTFSMDYTTCFTLQRTKMRYDPLIARMSSMIHGRCCTGLDVPSPSLALSACSGPKALPLGILRGSPPLPKAVGKFGLRKLIETPDYIVKMPFPSSKSGQKVEMSRMQKMPT